MLIIKTNGLFFIIKELYNHFSKCFTNIKKALDEYENGNIDIHRYIWIYLKKPTKRKKIIKIKKVIKKIKKISFIVCIKKFFKNS